MSCPAPALKDLPRVAGDLKSELEGFKTDSLKNADTQEKIILPSAEGERLAFSNLILSYSKNRYRKCVNRR